MSLVEAYLNSDQFVTHLAALCKNRTNAMALRTKASNLIATALRWHQLFENPHLDYRNLNLKELDQQDLHAYMENMVQAVQEGGLCFFMGFERNLTVINALKSAAQNIVDPTDPHPETKLIELYVRGATKYHGFNGILETSMRENGVDPHAKIYQQHELDAIEKILQKINWSLGWSHKDRDSVCYATTSKVAYGYALSSPEWFKMFCGGDAYINRDYQRALNHIQNKLNNPAITIQEREVVLNFFEKYWETFACENNAAPKVLLSPYYEHESVITEQINEYVSHPEKDVFQSNAYVLDDVQSQEVVGKENFEIISLPKFDVLIEQVQTKLNNENNHETNREI